MAIQRIRFAAATSSTYTAGLQVMGAQGTGGTDPNGNYPQTGWGTAPPYSAGFTTPTGGKSTYAGTGGDSARTGILSLGSTVRVRIPLPAGTYTVKLITELVLNAPYMTANLRILDADGTTVLFAQPGTNYSIDGGPAGQQVSTAGTALLPFDTPDPGISITATGPFVLVELPGTGSFSSRLSEIVFDDGGLNGPNTPLTEATLAAAGLERADTRGSAAPSLSSGTLVIPHASSGGGWVGVRSSMAYNWSTSGEFRVEISAVQDGQIWAVMPAGEDGLVPAIRKTGSGANGIRFGTATAANDTLALLSWNADTDLADATGITHIRLRATATDIICEVSTNNFATSTTVGTRAKSTFTGISGWTALRTYLGGQATSGDSTYLTLGDAASGGAIPTITGISPTSGAVGTVVTITGTNLTGVTAATHGPTVAMTGLVVDSSTQVRATIASGSPATGTIRVTAPSGTAESGATFSVTPIFTSLSINNPNTTYTVGVMLSPITVTALDQFGNVFLGTIAPCTVSSLSLAYNVTGTLTRSFVSGVAVFNDLVPVALSLGGSLSINVTITGGFSTTAAALAGSIVSTSGSAGTLRFTARQLAGTVTANIGLTGTFNPLGAALAGGVSVGTTATGTLRFTARQLAGGITSTSTLTGGFALAAGPLLGVLTTASTITGNLSVVAAGITQIGGYGAVICRSSATQFDRRLFGKVFKRA